MFSNPSHNIEQFGLSHGQVIADFGAGSGFYAMEAAKTVAPTGKVFAIDLNRDLLDRLKHEAQRLHIHNIDIISGDLEKLGGTKVRDEGVDAVIASNIFFMLKDRASCVQEIKRVLKSNGRVLVIDWLGSFSGMGPHHASVFPKDEAIKFFKDAGFVFIKEISAGSHHYGMIFRKA